MPDTLKNMLHESGLLNRLSLSPAIDTLLGLMNAITILSRPDGSHGQLTLKLDDEVLGFFDLSVTLPVDPRDYVLTYEGDPNHPDAFRLAVALEPGVLTLLDKVKSLPGHVLKPAIAHDDASGEWLEETTGKVVLTGVSPVLVMKGIAGGIVEMSLSSSLEGPDDILQMNVAPKAVRLGDTGFGFVLNDGVAFDDAVDAVVSGRTVIDGQSQTLAADAAPWRGMLVRNAKFYLPPDLPFLGRRAADAYLSVGRAPTPGIDMAVHTSVPARDDRPGIEVLIECRDPTATGLTSFIPTLVEVSMTLPDSHHDTVGGAPVTFMSGKPVIVRARYARHPVAAGAAPMGEFSLAIESQGANGIFSVTGGPGDTGARIVVTATTLASVLIANGSGNALHMILGAAVGLSSFIEGGSVVVHGAEILTEGGVLPVGKKVRLKLDYSVASTVTAIDVGVLSVQMRPGQPLRVRVREVVMTIDPDQSGVSMFDLDYATSSLEVEDPGGWMVDGPDSLFDVLGTRSGRGSMWIEVDLRFKLDLGPVKVSGATIRATLDAQGRLSGSLRGLDASLDLAPMIHGQGSVQLVEDGFYAALSAYIDPLGHIGAQASIQTAGDMVKLSLGVDFPGPIPLLSTGLGLYGLGGVFAVNGRPAPAPPGQDPMAYQLTWDYEREGSFVPAPGFSFGLETVVATVPDMGFTFSARAGVFITTPDIAVRGAVTGRFMGPRVTIDQAEDAAEGIGARGVIVVDGSGVTVAVEGSYRIKHVLDVVVPVAARFPTSSADWYIHLGADGWNGEGRQMGPVRIRILPDIFNQQADGYLMLRGNGITTWPRGGQYTIGAGCFVIATGFGFDISLGLKPVLWANVFARADILLATNPITFIGVGTVGGRLHVGPFSIGVDAGIRVHVVDGARPYLHAEICGEVDLFFDTVRKCIPIDINAEPHSEIPPPATHPLDNAKGQTLVDDRYRVIGQLFESPSDATSEHAVWPDAIPMLSFATAPILAGIVAPQFKRAESYPPLERAVPLGNDLLRYDWTLMSLMLMDVTDADEVPVPGPLSCAWLDTLFGDPCKQAQPAELALLTPFGDLSLNALQDGGSSLPHDPLDARSRICKLLFRSAPGWAIGATARREGKGYRLPASLISTDPLQSEFSALATLMFPGDSGLFALTPGNAHALLPLPFTYVSSRTHVLEPPLEIEGASFRGWFAAGHANAPKHIHTDRHVLQDMQIELSAPVRDGRIVLLLDASDDGQPAAGTAVNVSDADGSWTLSQAIPHGAHRLLIFRQGAPSTYVSSLNLRFEPGIALGVVGIGGVTASADAAATQRTEAAADEAALLASAADAPPPQGGQASAETARCVLEPGRLYRIDVRMRWSGILSTYDETGKKVELARKEALPEMESERHYWFRTAKLRPAPSSPVALSTLNWANFVQVRRDLFDPDMLQRYLRGYEPAQSELHRFQDDPVRAHFSVSHVDALAFVYGFQLLCEIRRLDAPLHDDDPQILGGVKWTDNLKLVKDPGEVTIAQAYLDSPCKMPLPGVMVEASPVLLAQCWYEVRVLAKSLDPDKVKDGRLAGVTFRTSRWANGRDMLDGMGFHDVGLDFLRPDGDIDISGRTWPAGAVLGDDAMFEAALITLGMDGWPPATTPRTSVLWTHTGSEWRCAGLLVESPEPIHRPGRFEIGGLSSRMGTAVRPFEIVRWDRSGSRLLFLTANAVIPVSTRGPVFGRPVPPLFQLDAFDHPFIGPPAPRMGYLRMPGRPAFAEEAP